VPLHGTSSCQSLRAPGSLDGLFLVASDIGDIVDAGRDKSGIG
jgi:hypothetical protein